MARAAHYALPDAARKRESTESAVVRAERAIATQSRDSERRHTRFKARHYRRERDLAAALGWYVAMPRGDDPELTRRIIHALGHRLHFQLTSGHPLARRRAPMTRTALFGEILLLKRQMTDVR